MPKKPNAEIENTLYETGSWGEAFPKNTQFSNNVVRNPVTPKIDWDKSEGVLQEHNDIGKDFPFDERNPIKILSHFENHPTFKGQKDFKILREFIEYRLQNPDPRFAKPEKHHLNNQISQTILRDRTDE